MPKAQQWLRAHRGWLVAAGVALAVVVAFVWRDDFACWIGYVTTVDGLKPGARFFRDFMVGFAAITGLIIAAWRTSTFYRQTKMAESRLLSERFATAAELMAKETKTGNPAIAARISGIHVMEKLATSAPEEFVVQVIKNLIAYIKGHAQLTATPKLKGGETPTVPRMLGEDVKAAFAVLHNILGNENIKTKFKIDDAILDFREQDFSWLNLNYAHVNLSHYKRWVLTNFTSSWLIGANLGGANLSFAKLHKAGLYRATLTKADLSSADMTQADLHDADLRGAKYNKEDLAGADLTGATL